MNTTTTIKAFLYVLILFSFLLAVQHLTAQPTITSFAPISCPVGTTVSIIGTNFNTVPANNVVFFGSTRASVITSTSTNLTVIVPTGAIFAPITVLNTSTALAVLSTRFFSPTFNPSKDSITSTDIEPKIDFTVGAYPVSISIVDIDGDGKSDLAIVNQNSNTVSVLQKTGNNGTVSFATKVDFTTGSLPQSLSIGDIDGDGKIDLAIAVSNAVSVLRNTSSSNSVSFAAKVDFPAGTNPRSIAIVDIDGDGKLDLAIANSGSNTVSVLRNIGSSGIINFATKVDFITGTSPRSIAIGDIDGDEKPDLAVVNNGSNTVSVLRNTGSSSSISFATKVDFTVGTLPQSVSIGDLDGDGKLDLAIANYNSNMVSVLRNTSNSGNISLASKLDFSTGVGSNSVAIGDINGDGKPDLTIANAGSNSVSVLRNTGSNGIINFATKLDFATGSSPRFLAIGDIDGDGKPDLVATNLSSNNVSILHNNPLPQFPPPTITSFTPTNCAVGTTVSITGTGFNTILANNIVFFGATRAIVNTATSTILIVTVPIGATFAPITVLNTAYASAAYSTQFFNPIFSPNKGSITNSDFEPKVDFSISTGPFSAAIGDIDGDGKPDLVIANFGTSTNPGNTVSILRNIGNGMVSFSTKVDFTTGANPVSLSIGDIDGDGKPDLAITNYGSNGSGNTVSILRNTGSSGFVNFASKVDFTIGTGSRSVAIGDIDGDGKPDLAIANYSISTVSVLRNTGSSGTISFATKVDFATGSSPRFVAIGDLDGDSKPDLAIANGNSVSVLRKMGNIGTISFANKVDFSIGSSSLSLAIGDIDADGRLDLAVSSFNNLVSVLRNTGSSGTINFATKVDFATGTNPQSLAMGDFDGDGKLDIAIANYGSTGIGSTVSVLQNSCSNGTISFAAKVDFTTSLGPYSLVICDIDGDGKPDLATVNYNSNSISVLRNNPQFPTTITSFTPSNDSIGGTIIITGKNFNTNPTNNVVFFGATKGIVSATTSTSLTVIVPMGATFAPITVLNTVTASLAYSTQFFNPIFNPYKSNITFADISSKVDFETNTNPYSAAIGDLNGDGKPDLVTVNGGDTSSIFLNTSTPGTISFSTRVNLAIGFNPYSVAIGDIDGDGKLDLAVVYVGGMVSVLRNTSTGNIVSFAPKVDIVSNSPFSVAIGDLDLDGKPDLVTANFWSNTVSIMRNTGSIGNISFASKVDFATDSMPESIAIGDINGDGKPDLATSNSYRGTVSVLRNIGTIGTINLTQKVDFTTGGSKSIVIGDIDGDNKLDLAVSGGIMVSVLLNNGLSDTISFANKVDFGTGLNSNSLAIGDINGDGKPDLAVANNGSDSVSVLCNTGNSGTINFANKIDFATGTQPFSVNIGDVDGDGKPDLAVANNGSNSISVLRNNPQFSPIIFITSSLTPFTSCAGTVSNQQNFMISGAALTANIIITAPIGFEVSTTSNSGFGNSINLTQTSGIVNTTTIYIRLTGSPSGSSSGNIVCTSTGAPIQNVAVSSVVNTLSTSTNNLIICPSALPLTWNGKLYNASAIDTVILTNAVGCDSVTILKLTVKPTSSSINNVSICSNELPFTWNGLIFNTAGTQTKIGLTNSVGCDSSATLNLTVNPKPNVGFNINTPINQCLLNNNFEFTDTTSMSNITRTWYFNNSINGTTVIANKSFNNTGIFPIKLVVKSDKNCLDSILINVTVKASPVIGVILGQTNGLQISKPYIYSVTQQLNHTYNWSITNGILVTGQGTNVVTVQWINTGNGKIIAEITNSLDCNDTSLLNVNIGNVGLNNVENEPKIIIYPNPFNETLNITLQNNQILNKSILYDLLGKEILSTNKNELDVKELKPGVYLIQVQDNKGNKYFQKLLKN